MMDWTGKVCVVTGGAQGIGRELVTGFSSLGACVAFIDTNQEAGEQLLASLHRDGKNVLFVHGDIAEPAVLEGFSRRVADAFGGVDVLVNNACLTRGGILTPCGYDEFNYVLRVEVSAPYYLTQLFLPLFREGASVVNLSSTRAGMSQRDTESYSAAKGGISSLTHALANSLAGKVRVNAIAPGWIETGRGEHSEADRAQHPSGRVGQPDDILRAVLFLCDRENSFINGETLTIDGGMSRRMIYSGDEGWEHRP